MSIFDIFKSIENENSKNAPGKISWIIAGLGNPGLAYVNTRHNAGFMGLDKLAKMHGIDVNTKKFRGDCGYGTAGGERFLLLKPGTFMNLSGESVSSAANFYKIPPERVVIMYDDINLPPGKLRIRRKGSAGGHNGMKSIIALLGTEEFPRIRIGIGAKPRPDYDLADWVLSKFTEDDIKALEPALQNAAKAAELIIQGKTDEAMNKFSSK